MTNQPPAARFKRGPPCPPAIRLKKPPQSMTDQSIASNCASHKGRLLPLRQPPARGEIMVRLIAAAIRLGADPDRLSASYEDLADMAALPLDLVRRHVAGPDPMTALARDLMSMSLHRVTEALQTIDDPAEQLATAIRLYIRRAQDNPARTEFILRYGVNSSDVGRLIAIPLERCIRRGVLLGRFTIKENQIPASAAMIRGLIAGGATRVARQLHDWQAVGAHAVRFGLTGLGVYQSEAIRLASLRLPVVPPILLGDGVAVGDGSKRAQ